MLLFKLYKTRHICIVFPGAQVARKKRSVRRKRETADATTTVCDSLLTKEREYVSSNRTSIEVFLNQ